MTREDAWALLCEWTQSQGLRKHALGVEAAMRYYAHKFGEDEEKWSIVGLLHDFDYERYPNPPDHPQKGAEELRKRGYPEDIVRAILAHADWSGVPRDTLMAKALYACDELVGFLVACALVMPNKSIHEVRVETVTKKLKDKSFARKVNREDIYRGAEELGIELEEHIANVLEALKGIAEELGLSGK